MRARLIVLAFLALPFLEIATFVLVGRQIGVLATVALVIATSVLGSILLRWQGFGVMARIAQDTREGRNPGRELVHGVMILVAGVLLLMPGFLTDIVGILLFIPPIRDLGWRMMHTKINTFSGGFATFRGRNAGPGRRSGTIDLDATDYAETRPRDVRLRRIDRDDGSNLS